MRSTIKTSCFIGLARDGSIPVVETMPSAGITDRPTDARCCLFQSPLENVSRSINIAVQHKTTTGTMVNPNGQRFLDPLAAVTTILASPRSRNLDNKRTSFFRFVAQLPKELTPGRIQDTFGEMTACHAVDIKGFNGNQLMLGNDCLASVMCEVPALVRNAEMDALETPNSFTPVFTALAGSAQTSVNPTQLPFKFSVKSRVFNFSAVGNGRESLQSKVNSDGRVNRLDRRRVNLVIDHDLAEPLPGFKENSLLFDNSANRYAKITNFNNTLYAAYANAVATEDVTRITDREAIPPLYRFESRKARSLSTFLDAPEERGKRQIKSPIGVSFNLNRNIRKNLTTSPQSRKVKMLGVGRKCFTNISVVADTLGQAVIKEFSTNVEEVETARLLHRSGIQTISECSQHHRIIRDS